MNPNPNPKLLELSQIADWWATEGKEDLLIVGLFSWREGEEKKIAYTADMDAIWAPGIQEQQHGEWDVDFGILRKRLI